MRRAPLTSPRDPRSALLVRVPFWIEALRTPVDGDTAIVGLMARHPGAGHDLVGPALRLAARRLGGGAVRGGARPDDGERCACPCSSSASPSFRSRTAWAEPLHPRGGAARRRCSWPARRPISCCSRRCRRPSTRRRSLLCGAAARSRDAPRRAPRARRTPARRPGALGALAGLALWTHLMSRACVAAGLLCRPRARGAARACCSPALVPLLAGERAAGGRARSGAGPRGRAASADRERRCRRTCRGAAALHEPIGRPARAPTSPVVADVGATSSCPRRAAAAGALVLV